MTEIYFVRHGKTDATGKNLCGNLPGFHLNETGKHQAEETAKYLKKLPIKAIFASPLERTLETAVLLAEEHDLAVTRLECLREINFGSFQGMNVEELKQLDLWNQFWIHPDQVRFPGGETIFETQKRVVEGLNQLTKEFGEEDEIICVAHCEVIRLAIAAVLELPITQYQRLTIHTASVSKVSWGK